MLRAAKGIVAALMKRLIVRLPFPLSFQAWAIRHLLPMDPWPRSLVYQQCLANRILRRAGAAAQSGPFQGMTCLRDAEEGCLVPKLLGCYEEELAPAAENLIKTGFNRIIDVGCASGYWLTGLALRIPNAEAIGFDADEKALARCAQLTALNSVAPRVTLKQRCTTDHLKELVTERTLLFMDCDGPEYELLDPEVAPALRRASIIVECHDFIDPRITPTLLSRFRDSHDIDRISSRPRVPDPERYPGLRALPSRHWAAALDERRPCVQDWLVMRPSTGNARPEVCRN
jgi:hypothetical protein